MMALNVRLDQTGNNIHDAIVYTLPGVTSITAMTTKPHMTRITSKAMTMPRQFLLSDSPPTSSCIQQQQQCSRRFVFVYIRRSEWFRLLDNPTGWVITLRC